MSIDVAMPALALKLITKYGKSVTYTPITEGTFDPATQQATPSPATALSIKALVEDYPALKYGAQFGPGENGMILEGDKKVSVAASSFSSYPKPGDKVAVSGGDTYVVRNVKTLFAGETAALHELHART